MNSPSNNPFAPPEQFASTGPTATAEYTPDEALSVEYQLTDDDYIGWVLHWQAQSPTLRWNRVRAFGILAGAIAFGAFYIASSIIEPVGRILVTVVASVLIVSILYKAWRGPKQQTTKLLRKMLAEGENKMRRLPSRLTIRPRGLETINRLIESKISWECVERIEDVDQWIFISISSTDSLIVPKAAFPSPEYYHRFVSAARSFRAQANKV